MTPASSVGRGARICSVGSVFSSDKLDTSFTQVRISLEYRLVLLRYVSQWKQKCLNLTSISSTLSPVRYMVYVHKTSQVGTFCPTNISYKNTILLFIRPLTISLHKNSETPSLIRCFPVPSVSTCKPEPKFSECGQRIF